MSVLVDTSAILPLLDADATDHAAAAAAFDRLLDERVALVTSSYVLVEATALLQRRIGLAPVRALHDRLVPLLEVEWVGAELHGLAARVLDGAGRRGVSLVDRVSFELMHRRGITAAFAFDEDFAREGFHLLP